VPEPISIRFPSHGDATGQLTVYETGATVPFDIRRVFTVTSVAGRGGGHHAHKRCSQLLVCVHGRIRVTCDNGTNKSEHVLDSSTRGLLLPPGIWAAQEYITEGATLMVLCDRRYEAEDYIREYAEFETFSRDQQAGAQSSMKPA
jgi:dTDP-4-dehydrorhamnose 3,5-epimerase-like enzyme